MFSLIILLLFTLFLPLLCVQNFFILNKKRNPEE